MREHGSCHDLSIISSQPGDTMTTWKHSNAGFVRFGALTGERKKERKREREKEEKERKREREGDHLNEVLHLCVPGKPAS